MKGDKLDLTMAVCLCILLDSKEESEFSESRSVLEEKSELDSEELELDLLEDETRFLIIVGWDSNA